VGEIGTRWLTEPQAEGAPRTSHNSHWTYSGRLAKKGLELQRWYNSEDRQPIDISRYYGEIDISRDFDNWPHEIMDFLTP
jgi:hypothetical protein